MVGHVETLLFNISYAIAHGIPHDHRPRSEVQGSRCAVSSHAGYRYTQSIAPQP